MDNLLPHVQWEQLLTKVVAWLPDLVAALLVMLGFLLLYRLTRSPLRAALRRTGLEPGLLTLLVDRLYKWLLFLGGLVMALDQLNVKVTTALAGLGIAGVAVGLAAQDSLANLIGGILIFADKPFVVGDWIVTGEQYGQVTEITLRSTRIRTNRNTYVVIPNKTIIDSVLENHSKHGAMRMDVKVGIAYKEDLRQARAVILEALEQVEGIAAEPAPDVVVDQLGNSSVDLKVRVWLDDVGLYRPVHYRVMEACKLALDAAGIEIPFPHLQLFVDEVKPPVWRAAEASLARRAAADRDGEEPPRPGSPEPRDG